MSENNAERSPGEFMRQAMEGGGGLDTFFARRSFLAALLGSFGTFFAGLSIYGIVRFFSPPGQEAAVKDVVVKKGALAPGRAHEVMYGSTPLLVVRDEAGAVTVFSAVCTHLGCLVKWVPRGAAKGAPAAVTDPYVFYCPCHDGVFDSHGRVIAGPAPLPLEKIPFEERGDEIIIGRKSS
ncbi:MAG: ubiquinol-cytochrome c reductase iron-sulfur subunit [Candidatus Eremiobacteraeota bacterium]|nr:ubiquinol-cytochrome c reductase iron-sulfur subunit [Candidatus Eremiobacteraeota bacterium]